MTRTEMLLELKSLLNASSIAELWGDPLLVRYLSEGQDKFCEDTGYFKDNSNYSITLVSGASTYDIPDRVIQIIDIWDGTRRLNKILTGTVVEDYSEDSDPTHWSTDTETGTIKLFPTPTDDEDGDSFTLQVWRYSVNELSGASAEPEIPSRFHRACIEWAAYKALMHHDADLQDPVKAGAHKAAYLEYATQGKRARQRYQNEEVRVGTDPAYRT